MSLPKVRAPRVYLPLWAVSISIGVLDVRLYFAERPPQGDALYYQIVLNSLRDCFLEFVGSFHQSGRAGSLGFKFFGVP